MNNIEAKEVIISKYRLMKTIDDQTHFAEVECKIIADFNPQNPVTVEISRDLDVICEDWIEPAILGAKKALNFSELQARSVEIIGIKGTMVDTRTDTVYIASFGATLLCLGMSEENLPQPYFNKRWKIDIK